MVKSIKELPFSMVQKISEVDSIVWLKESNKYLVLNSNTLALIKKKSSLSLNGFLTLMTESLNVDVSIAKKINKDISELLLETKELDLKRDIKHPDPIKSCQLINYYSFNNTIIKVGFDAEETKSLIHQKYRHLVIDHVNSFDVEYSIFNSDHSLFIFKNNKIVGSWDIGTQLHEFQGKFSMELICSFYNKTEHDWMGVFHASTISKNNHSIMFTGDSGNGKSTLISILMANGYNVIADDFSPVLRSDFKTYCFPSAISIKEKSFNLIEQLYPDFINYNEYYINELKGNVKYLPPISKETSANCSSVIWVKYAKGTESSLKKVSIKDALKKILPDAWISNKEVNAKAFLKWIEKTAFYELNYSDNNQLIDIINSCFLEFKKQ
jgi:predicted RNA-binding protein with PIN domain